MFLCYHPFKMEISSSSLLLLSPLKFTKHNSIASLSGLSLASLFFQLLSFFYPLFMSHTFYPHLLLCSQDPSVLLFLYPCVPSLLLRLGGVLRMVKGRPLLFFLWLWFSSSLSVHQVPPADEPRISQSYRLWSYLLRFHDKQEKHGKKGKYKRWCCRSLHPHPSAKLYDYDKFDTPMVTTLFPLAMLENLISMYRHTNFNHKPRPFITWI